MRKALTILFLVIGCSANAQSFNLKELLSFKDHDIEFFHHYVRSKGYTYEKSKYDLKKESYSYIFLPDVEYELHQIKYVAGDRGPMITYISTDSADYYQFKRQLELLQFKVVRHVPKQENGRSVLMIVYTDGNNTVNLYNSYIEDATHSFLRLYRIKIL
jgi:hypothetical protein